jgi:hypothetical protein
LDRNYDGILVNNHYTTGGWLQWQNKGPIRVEQTRFLCTAPMNTPQLAQEGPISVTYNRSRSGIALFGLPDQSQVIGNGTPPGTEQQRIDRENVFSGSRVGIGALSFRNLTIQNCRFDGLQLPDNFPPEAPYATIGIINASGPNPIAKETLTVAACTFRELNQGVLNLDNVNSLRVTNGMANTNSPMATARENRFSDLPFIAVGNNEYFSCAVNVIEAPGYPRSITVERCSVMRVNHGIYLSYLEIPSSSPSSTSTFSITRNKLSEVVWGIRGEGFAFTGGPNFTIVPPRYVIQRNEIRNCSRGITLFGVGAPPVPPGIDPLTYMPSIENNVISQLNQPIDIIPSYPASLFSSLAGIEYAGCDLLNIAGNTIHGPVDWDNHYDTPNYTNVRINGLNGIASHNCRIGCNRMGRLPIAMAFDLGNYGATLTRNVFEACSTGVELRQDALIGEQATLTNGKKTSNFNVWKDVSVGLRVIETDGRLSNFTVNANPSATVTNTPGYFIHPAQGNNPNVIPSEVIVPPGVFPCNLTLPAPSCAIELWPCTVNMGNCTTGATGCGSGSGWPVVSFVGLQDSIGTELYEYWRIATGRVVLPNYPAEGLWQANRYLFTELERRPQLRIAFPELDSFYHAHAGTAMADQLVVDRKLAQGDTLTARLLEAGIEPTNLPEANVRVVQRARLRLRTLGQEAAAHAGLGSLPAAARLTPQEKAAICQVARQCPLTGGVAVYHARTLRTQFDPGFHHYPDDCTPDPDAALKTGGATAATALPKPARLRLELTPNPTTGRVELRCSGLVPERPAFVDVHDTRGQHLRRIPLAPEPGTTRLTQTLDLGGLPAGLYFCTLFTAHSPAVTQKLVLTR